MRLIYTIIFFLLTEVAFCQQPFEILVDNQSTGTVHFRFRDMKDSLSGKQSRNLTVENWNGAPSYLYAWVASNNPEERVASKFWIFSPDANRKLIIQPDRTIWLDTSIDEMKLQKYLVAANKHDSWTTTRKFIKENRDNEIAAHAIALNLLFSHYDVSTIERQYRKLTDNAKTEWAATVIEKYLAGRRLLTRGNVMPAFHLPDATANKLSLESFSSKYILLYFWPPSCDGVCGRQLPDLKNLYKVTDRSKLEIVTISLEASIDAMKNSVLEHQIPWVNLHDPNTTYTFGTLAISKFPTKVLVDATGKIVRVDPSAQEVEAYIGRK